MNEKYPVRKRLRLKSYDYSQNGCYFVTICSKDRRSVFGSIDIALGGKAECLLSGLGLVLQEQWLLLDNRFPGTCVLPFCIMPNHFHGVITLPCKTWSEEVPQQEHTTDDGRQGQSPCPTLGDIVGSFKSVTTRLYNQSGGARGITVWQSRYYDRIIRDEKEYLMICQYIEQNAAKWKEDRYHDANDLGIEDQLMVIAANEVYR